MIPPAGLAASDWVKRWAHLIPPAGRVLDLACGGGRHAVYLAGRGHHVLAADLDLTLAQAHCDIPGITWQQVDLEAAPWPYGGERFQGIIVTHYLHRPLFEPIAAALAPGGVLIYETFSLGQARYGRPRNPAHLLLPGELLEMARGKLRIVAFEDVDEAERRRCVQRLCAMRA